MSGKEIINANIIVHGIVQGVGFRPFIHRQISDLGLVGWIRNTSHGAEIEVEGAKEVILSFVSNIENNPPKLALIEKVEVSYSVELKRYADFKIIESKKQDQMDTLISPDISICEDCLKEMSDPKDRRYMYPFINCTNCGPRFTIIKDTPYDRDKTTMAPFDMCNPCFSEYTDIEDRRYHAQPVCCPDCGPELVFLDGSDIKADALETKILELSGLAGNKDNSNNINAILNGKKYLEEGKILAVKGLGGIHLACRYDNPSLVRELRKRKQRDEKPFALMMRDVEAVKRICFLGPEEEKVLTSFRRPIVLLRKKEESKYRFISENNYLGVMLPYTPLHYLLFEWADYDGLVMTSANISDLPIMYKNKEAVEKLKSIADGFLLNNREIETRCDDSLLWVVEGREYFVRRSRGYVPFPVKIKGFEGANNILACGAEQKASFALSKDYYVFPSQHIGDLKNMETLENYEGQIKHFENMFSIDPKTIVCDMHPDYLSTEYAKKRAEKEGIELIAVQHHHAHMASCMADNGLDEKCIGIIWDGTGLGDQRDETIWGGEFLVGDYEGFERAGSIKPIRLPGGDKASKEIWRCGISLIVESDPDSDLNANKPETIIKTFKGGNQHSIENIIGKALCRYPEDQAKNVKYMLDNNINCPVSTSMGRLFDGVASILGIKQEVSYEGQGAVLLEAEALEGITDCFPYEIIKNDKYYYDYSFMIGSILSALEQSGNEGDASLKEIVPRLAAMFMNTMVDMAAEISKLIRDDTLVNKVVLSGGTFQNQYMLKRLYTKLSEEGFEVYHHKRVSTNDEGIALGQIMVAQAQKK